MAVVAKEFGWGYETFQSMTFHELVMLWYPRAVEMRKVRQDDMMTSIMLASVQGFTGGQRS